LIDEPLLLMHRRPPAAFLYASGLCPIDAIPKLLMRLRFRDILIPFWRRSPLCWLRGGVFRIRTDILAATCSPVTRLEAAPRCPIALSTHDVRADETAVHVAGDAASIVAASCAVPVLMQAVMLPSPHGRDGAPVGDGAAQPRADAARPHVDGCIADPLALASVGGAERLLCIDLYVGGRLDAGRPGHMADEQARRWAAGRRLAGAVFVRVRHLPAVFPTNMASVGPAAFQAAYEAMEAALEEQRDAWGDECVVEAAAAQTTSAPAEQPL